ncbi:MAG TPA: UPF0175 family protein [Acidobacteriaceae bacterium]|nr:UPF0175 family protein [Acidobacteriaceae bacterium]
MQIQIELPDDIAQHPDPGREALEALVIAGYSSGAISSHQARVMLGFETRFDLDDFLQAHNVEAGSYGVEQYEQDLVAIRKMDQSPPEKRNA